MGNFKCPLGHGKLVVLVALNCQVEKLSFIAFFSLRYICSTYYAIFAEHLELHYRTQYDFINNYHGGKRLIGWYDSDGPWVKCSFCSEYFVPLIFKTFSHFFLFLFVCFVFFCFVFVFCSLFIYYFFYFNFIQIF